MCSVINQATTKNQIVVAQFIEPNLINSKDNKLPKNLKKPKKTKRFTKNSQILQKNF